MTLSTMTILGSLGITTVNRNNVGFFSAYKVVIESTSLITDPCVFAVDNVAKYASVNAA
jgi:hypothetical protein